MPLQSARILAKRPCVSHVKAAHLPRNTLMVNMLHISRLGGPFIAYMRNQLQRKFW